MDVGVAHRPGQRQQRRDAGAVVGNPRPVEAIAFAPDVDSGSGWKHGINVRADRQVLGLTLRGQAGADADDVANAVNVHVAEAELAETRCQPLGARRLAKRGRGDARHLHLALQQVLLVRQEPGRGGFHRSQRRDARHLLRGGSLRRGLGLRG